MYIFQTRSFWKLMGVSQAKIRKQFNYFFGSNEKVIDDRRKALEILNNVLFTAQNNMLKRIKNLSTFQIP